MYFGYKQTLDWCRRVSQIASIHPAVALGYVDLFVLPSAPTLSQVRPMLSSCGVGLGAQNFHYEDAGAFTGEVSGKFLHELGCSHAEIGHAERKALFHESDTDVALKVAAAFRNQLVPILCIGESQNLGPELAAEVCIAQIQKAIELLGDRPSPMVLAYEPIWAIGATEPASVEHIAAVAKPIQEFVKTHEQLAGSKVIYGGTAGPGLLSSLGHNIDGLFLGRLAHNPENLITILDEALRIATDTGVAKAS